MRSVAAIASVILLASCTVGEVRLSGRACPCVDDWVCDKPTNTCVRSTPGFDDGAIDVVAFSAAWATPNWIRWEWELAGQAEDFAAFQLVIGTSEEDVIAGTNVRIVTGDENPELDRFLLPRTEGDDPVVATHTDGHEPDTEYFAQLVVIDTEGRSSRSATVVRRRTALSPIGAIPVFEDTSQAAYVLPECASVQPGNAHEGSAAYAMTNYCEDIDGVPYGVCMPAESTAGACWRNITLAETNVSMVTLTEGNFDDAYLEFALRIDDSPHAYWASVGVQDGDNSVASLEPITFRADGAYRVHQIPLAALGKSHASYAGVLDGVNVGGEWGVGATVRIDSIAVRW